MIFKFNLVNFTNKVNLVFYQYIIILLLFSIFGFIF